MQDYLDPKDHAGSALKTALIASDVEGGVMIVSSILAGIFLLVWLVQQVNKILIEGNALNKIDILKVIGLLVLFSFYSDLIHRVTDPMMNLITKAVVEKVADPGDPYKELMDLKIRSEKLNDGLWVSPQIKIKAEISTWWMESLIWLDNGIAYFFDLYIQISLFFVRIFGPIAIVFTLFPGFGSTFLTWLKMYFKYHLYAMVLGIGIILARSYLFYYFDGSFSDALVFPRMFISIMLSYIIFKLLFVLMGFKILDRLFGGGIVGVGGMVGGIIERGTQMVGEATGRVKNILPK